MIFRVSLFMSVVAILCSTSAFARCPEFLDRLPHDFQQNNSLSLIAYLETLLKNGVLEDRHVDELYSWIESESKGEFIPKIDVSLHIEIQIHHKEINKYLRSPSFNKQEILQWIQLRRERKKLASVERQQAQSTTEIPITFYRIPKGDFVMGDVDKPIRATIHQEFEVSSTVITQDHWTRIMGANPSYFQSGPEYPVENITWWSALEYANRLSKYFGLPETYDFSDVTFKQDTRADNGTWVHRSGKLRINAEDQDIYLAKGYRLPTVAEQEYILRKLGTSNTYYSFGNDAESLTEYGWFSGNSRQKTWPVGDLKAILIHGNPLFDLHGNVAEWSFDFQDSTYEGGKNPCGNTGSFLRMTRGGSWNSPETECRSNAGTSRGMNGRYSFVGFRLVRTLPTSP